jgi:hypothetical protein
LSRWHASSRGLSLPGRVALLWAARRRAELTRFRLHLGILSSFLIGAIVGPSLYLRVGYLSMLCPVMLLAGLAAFDSRIGFQFRRHAAAHAGHSLSGAFAVARPLEASTAAGDLKQAS